MVTTGLLVKPETVLADATLPLVEPYARKIVSELVDNALRFSEAGKPIQVSFTASGRRVTLSVADAGRGMTLDQIREVGAFRQFNRAVFEQQGSGLGLILVKGIIEAVEFPGVRGVRVVTRGSRLPLQV